MRAHERVRIVQLRAAQEVEAASIHQNPGARLLDHEVVRGRRRLVEVEFVLESAAAACQNGHPQGGRPWLAVQDLGNAGDRALGQAKIRRLGAHRDSIAL
jgi:hypothetical protein